MRNLLFLSHQIPYPPDKGEKIRAWHIFRHLAQSYRMHLGCFAFDPADLAHVSHLRTLCADVACFPLGRRRQKLRALARFRPGRPLMLDYYRDERLQRWVDAAFAGSDIERVFVFSSAMAPYVMDHACRGVLDMVDVDSEKWSDYARRSAWPMRAVWAREGRTLLAFERKAAMHFDHTLFVSGDEHRRFTELAPESRGRTGWIENGVDLVRFAPGLALDTPFAAGGPDIVFTGTMDYWPNADAVSWFAREVMPLLRQRRPGLRFAIVGANPSAEVQKLASLPGVSVTGRVADTRPYIAHAAVVVAPLRIARGIQNKILEAMAMGKPVVATPQAFEGVRATPGRHLLVADGAEATARSIGELLDGQHAGLGAAARQAVELAYDWSATLGGLDALLEDPLPQHPRHLLPSCAE